MKDLDKLLDGSVSFPLSVEEKIMAMDYFDICKLRAKVRHLDSLCSKVLMKKKEKSI